MTRFLTQFRLCKGIDLRVTINLAIYANRIFQCLISYIFQLSAMNWSKVFSAAVLLVFAITSLHGNDARMSNILTLTENTPGIIANLTLTYVRNII